MLFSKLGNTDGRLAHAGLTVQPSLSRNDKIGSLDLLLEVRRINHKINAANKLRAKDLPTFDPSVDAGAFVVVVNAALVKLTGKKEQQKDYQRYSGYRDGLKHFTAAEMRAKHPDRMIKEAVWGMLPKNNIARKMMTRVKVFAGAEHTHAAQKPVEIKL